MWMRAPTPLTMKSIERLNGSSVRPRGTEKSGARLIQEIESAADVCWKKMRQLQTKLPRTAATEINALSVRNCRVAIRMMNADPRGRRRAIQGRDKVIAVFSGERTC